MSSYSDFLTRTENGQEITISVAELLRIILAGKHADDTETGGIHIIDSAHFKTHNGHKYFTSYKTADDAPLADNGELVFGLTTGSCSVHMHGSGATGGDTEALFYEGAAFTGGTTQTIYNKKRTSSNTASSKVVRDPSISSAGTLLENELIPGGTGRRAVGGAGDQETGWILKANTKYLFKIVNRSGAAQPASIAIEWCESDS